MVTEEKERAVKASGPLVIEDGTLIYCDTCRGVRPHFVSACGHSSAEGMGKEFDGDPYLVFDVQCRDCTSITATVFCPEGE